MHKEEPRGITPGPNGLAVTLPGDISHWAGELTHLRAAMVIAMGDVADVVLDDMGLGGFRPLQINHGKGEGYTLHNIQ